MKIKNIFITALAALSLTSCMDLEPVSSISDSKYWKDQAQFAAFNVGLQGLFREKSFQFYEWGELRTNLYAGTPFSGEAVHYNNLFNNTLNATTPEVTDFGGVYTIINQINLMISHTENTDVLNEAQRKTYLGAAYGMRAYLYFHLLRTYGKAVLWLDYTTGNKVDIGNMGKAEASAQEVMEQIKKDIKASEDAYGADMSFTNGRVYWSHPATEVLKGEVYLWSGKQMNGGNSDYTIAKTALESLKTADVALENNYRQVFAFDNKENKEIIFAIHNGRDEYNMFNDALRYNLVMNQMMMENYYLSDGTQMSKSEMSDMSGVVYIPLNTKLYKDLFREGDTRRQYSLKDCYTKNADGSLQYVGVVQYKFIGVSLPGNSYRSFLEDYPIYRYADALLLLAETKILLNEDPSAEINAVRERAYGKKYFAEHKDQLAYPNDTDNSFYANNPFVDSDANPIEAVLKERCREFLLEGKRWYDLRLMGAEYCTKYTSANAKRLLWPIDQNSLGENSLLKQTEGYNN